MLYTLEQCDIAAQRYLKLEAFFANRETPELYVFGGEYRIASGAGLFYGDTLGEAIDNLPPRTNQILR